MSYEDIAGIKSGQRDKLRSELATAREAAKQARAHLTRLRESAESEGVDLGPDSEAFKALNEASGEFSTLNQKAEELAYALERLQVIDAELANGTVADGEKKIAEIEQHNTEVEKGRRRDVVTRAVDRFMDSPDYRGVREKMARWTKGDPAPRFSVEDVIKRSELMGLIGFRAAGDNVLTGASNTSAGALVWPEEDSRYIDLPFRATRVLDVITKGTTDSDTIEYVAETTKTNAAAATAEATDGSTGALAEAALVLAVRSVAVENIGHYIPATTRALADAGQLDTILRQFLIEGVLVELEDEVLGGDGSTPNLEGIYTAVTQAQALGGDTKSDALLKAQTVVRTAASINDRYEPTVIVAHPNDGQRLRLEKNDIGDYTFGGPTAPRNFPVWGMQLVESLGATEGTPFVFDPRFAQLWVREGVAVSVSDSHDDWFISNIIAMKAQMRAAFKLTRAASACEITGFNV